MEGPSEPHRRLVPRVDETDPPLGAWARADQLVGLVAAVDADQVTLLDPGNRQVARVARSAVQLVPAGAVTISVSVDVPLAHGLDESDLRRWVAALTDEVLRTRMRDALGEGGMDVGAALPLPRVDVRAVQTSGAVCLCGARTPAADGQAVTCGGCGRLAVARPPSQSAGDVLGL